MVTTTTVTTGVTRTTQLVMAGDQALVVEQNAFFTTAAPLVLFNTSTALPSFVTNSGTMTTTNRAIRVDTFTAPLALTVTNNATGTISTGSDGLQLDDPITSGSLVINNAGLWESTGAQQAIDSGNSSGTMTVTITNSLNATIRSLSDDAIRVGTGGAITNAGTINGGSAAAHAAGSDGIQFQTNGSGTVTNNANGTISGDRHGINAGTGSEITVTNNVGVTIIGRNGSGVGSDHNATVVNHGTITGNYANIAGSDEHGLNNPNNPDGTNDGDGDGIDIDRLATITNSGTIQGLGAGGHGSDGQPNTAEAIAAGGGVINNLAGGLIEGQRGILIDDSSGGNSFAATSITNSGTIRGTDFYAIRFISTFGNTITNNGLIEGNDTNNGNITIRFGGGNDILSIGAGSQIIGITDGEGGTNTIGYIAYGSGVTVNLLTGAATATGGVANFQIVAGSEFDDTITGNANVNILEGRDGNDTLDGGGSLDQLYGMAGNDTLIGGAGDDILEGGLGNDVYSVDSLADVVTELAGAGSGNDTVFSLVNTTLSANVESLIMASNGNQNGTGSNDNNWIYGNAFDNVINGGGGNDLMVGAAGNDTYVVNIGYDAVSELANGGTDQVYSTTDYQISDNVEVLLLTGAAVLGIGNNGNNWIYGTASANNLQGLGGSDTIYGYGGADTIDGGAGIDDMRGGADSDIYYVDNVGDFITELGGEGTNDAVYASISYGVAANVESIIANTAAGVGLSGNNGANFVIGNAGADMLDAYGASDWMQGAGGNDRFVLRKGMTNGDVISDFAGNGAAAGDSLLLIGWGAGATITSLGANNWRINSTLGNEVFSMTNGATLDASDFIFV